MDTIRKERTIAGTVAVEGFGYWTGQDVRVEFRPAPPRSGIVFVRSDLPGCPRIEAVSGNRVETPRRTSLHHGEASVDMIEHIMAALSGVGVENCEAWVDQPEMPGCDGSSLPFVRALEQAGLVDQETDRVQRYVTSVHRCGTDKCWLEARPSPNGRTVLKYDLDYGPESPIGRQTFALELTPESFRRELAPSRTFMLRSEADWIQSQGLGLRATYRDLLVYESGGPIENELRFSDECVRHKLLDLVGDLALAGSELIGHFTAYRSGHRQNAEMVRALMNPSAQLQPWRRCA